ncbi:hypothetical protein MCZ49_15550 [Bacillus safensis]|uniref:hypothetical protein n=1 Tax=Bacillus safensis TaxID=561879 RepID=UPI002282908C|nr:hypothetical protein [Bacillus safensis]MCY7433135.1 hypothetical protein [Bacillus safensis]
MSMKLLKQHLKENGKEYYEKVVANHNRVIEMNKSQYNVLLAASLKKINEK